MLWFREDYLKKKKHPTGMAFGERLISSYKNFLNSKKQTPNLATPPPAGGIRQWILTVFPNVPKRF